MAALDATIVLTADWLCKTTLVVFTNRAKDQPLLADPFPLYQQCVKDNKDFFKAVHNYEPAANTKTGLAGVRSRVYTKVWRDHVILQALRIYRARMERASLDTVPEVTYSQKPSCDGRADKSVAQRGIMGFEPITARRGYVYNPDRNPNLVASTELPVDREVCLLPYDQAADVRMGEKESPTLKAYADYGARPMGEPVAKRKTYMCPTCNVPKKGHICTAPKRKGAPVKRPAKRARK